MQLQSQWTASSGGSLGTSLVSYSTIRMPPARLPVAAGCPHDSATLRAALPSSGLLLQPLGAPPLHLAAPQALVTVVDIFSGAGLANLTIKGLQVGCVVYLRYGKRQSASDAAAAVVLWQLAGDVHDGCTLDVVV